MMALILIVITDQIRHIRINEEYNKRLAIKEK